MVDLDTFEEIKNYSWHSSWKKDIEGYYIEHTEYLGMIEGKPKYKVITLHNFIIKPPDGVVVDHINHNTLDNRRCNLRLACKSKNGRNRRGKNTNNTSGYRNVSWIDAYKKWVVQLQINGTNKILGKFDDVHKAGEFAEEMRNKYYKSYAGKN